MDTGFITSPANYESSAGLLFKDEMNFSSKIITAPNEHIVDEIQKVIDTSTSYEDFLKNIKQPFGIFPLLEYFGFTLDDLYIASTEDIIIHINETIKFQNFQAIHYDAPKDKYEKLRLITTIWVGIVAGPIGDFFGATLIWVAFTALTDIETLFKNPLKFIEHIFTNAWKGFFGGLFGKKGHTYYYYHTQQIGKPNNEWIPDPVATAAAIAVQTNQDIATQVQNDVINSAANNVRKAYIYAKHRFPECLLKWHFANLQRDNYGMANENPITLNSLDLTKFNPFIENILNETRPYKVISCSFVEEQLGELALSQIKSLTGKSNFAPLPFSNYGIAKLSGEELPYNSGKTEQDLPEAYIIGNDISDTGKLYIVQKDNSNLSSVLDTSNYTILPQRWNPTDTQTGGMTYYTSSRGFELIDTLTFPNQEYTESEFEYELDIPDDGTWKLCNELSGEIAKDFYFGLDTLRFSLTEDDDIDNFDPTTEIENLNFFQYWTALSDIVKSSYGNKDYKLKCYRKLEEITSEGKYVVATKIEIEICEYDDDNFVWITKTQESHQGIRTELEAILWELNPLNTPSYVNFNTLYVTSSQQGSGWYYNPYPVFFMRNKWNSSIGAGETYRNARHALEQATKKSIMSDNDTSPKGTAKEDKIQSKLDRTNERLKHTKNARIANNPKIYARNMVPVNTGHCSHKMAKRHLGYIHEHLYGEAWENLADIYQQSGQDKLYDAYKIPTLPLISEIDSVNEYWFNFWKTLYNKFGDRTYNSVVEALNVIPTETMTWQKDISKLPLYEFRFWANEGYIDSNFQCGFRFSFIRRFRMRGIARKTRGKHRLCDVFLCKGRDLSRLKGATLKKYILNPPEVQMERSIVTNPNGKQYPIGIKGNFIIEEYPDDPVTEVGASTQASRHVSYGNPPLYTQSYRDSYYTCFARDLGNGELDCIGVAGLVTFCNSAYDNQKENVRHFGWIQNTGYQEVNHGFIKMYKRTVAPTDTDFSIATYTETTTESYLGDHDWETITTKSAPNAETILNHVIYKDSEFEFTLRQVLDILGLSLEDPVPSFITINSDNGHSIQTTQHYEQRLSNSTLSAIQQYITEYVTTNTKRNLANFNYSVKGYRELPKKSTARWTRTSSFSRGYPITLKYDEVRARPYHESEVDDGIQYTYESATGSKDKYVTRIQTHGTCMIPIDYNTLKRMSGLWVARLQPRIGIMVTWTYQYHKKLEGWVMTVVRVIGLIVSIVVSFFTGGAGFAGYLAIEGAAAVAVNIIAGVVLNLVVSFVVKGLIKVLGIKNTIILIILIVIAMIVAQNFDFSFLGSATQSATTSASQHIAVNATEATLTGATTNMLSEAVTSTASEVVTTSIDSAVTEMVLSSATETINTSVTQTLSNMVIDSVKQQIAEVVSNPLTFAQKTLDVVGAEYQKILQTNYNELAEQIKNETDKFAEAMAELNKAKADFNDVRGNIDAKAVISAVTQFRQERLAHNVPPEVFIDYCLDTSDMECKYDFLSTMVQRKLETNPYFFDPIVNVQV